jgi:hypothetical protein
LLRALGETTGSIHHHILISRQKFLKDFMQTSMIKLGSKAS